MASPFSLVFDRHLQPFDPRRVPQYRFDVLVIGGGAAGGAAALSAADAGASVALVSKSELAESNTRYAQGGVAAVLAREDSFDSHVADTLRVGCGLSDASVVGDVVRAGPEAIEALLALGAQFDRQSDGQLDLSREGGHSQRRIVHARGDSTGKEIQETLAAAIAIHPGITTFENTFAIDLLSAEGEPGSQSVRGALAWTARGEPVTFLAPQVILATGGAGQVYRETTNPVIATGDGIGLGFRAGAVVRDLEFFQFHPTCLYIAGAARVLISEIVRGAGGVLRDREHVRFMQDFHPDAELAPRDVVSRAVFERMVETGDTNVYLDLSGLAGDPHKLFPGISRTCRFFGIDIARDPVPVRPGAHYMIGGLAVDEDSRTTLPGLWAVGECASTRLHGANRMGSNSLLEGLVLGRRAGQRAAAEPSPPGFSAFARLPAGESVDTGRTLRQVQDAGIEVNLIDITYSLKSLMWRAMGVVRNGDELRDAQSRIDLWSRAVRELAPPGPRTWELINMLTLARLASIAALAREESRGVHYRGDFPSEDPTWRVHNELVPCMNERTITAVELRQLPVRLVAAAPRSEAAAPRS